MLKVISRYTVLSWSRTRSSCFSEKCRWLESKT